MPSPRNNKTMDFFRPTRAADPLANRPKISSVSPQLNKAQPKSSPTTLSRKVKTPPVRPQITQTSVSTSRTVIQKASGTRSTASVTTTTVSATTRPISKPSAPKPRVSQPTPKPAPKPPIQDNDDWFDLTKEDLANAPKGKVSYPFGGESPFLKSVKVEKRPLSSSVPPKSPFERPGFGSSKPNRRPDPVRIRSRASSRSNALSLIVIIIITIILGIAAGVGVFLLIAK